MVGEQGREAHTKQTDPYVFVLDKNHIPLQPRPPARARKLLTKKRAVVARHTPFTIRLTDRTSAESEIDGVEIGIDPGSKHTGIALFTARAGERRGRYARTTPDRHGFPRLRAARQKQYFSFTTGDLVRAVVPSGRRAGTHTGRVLVRARVSFDITTGHGRHAGINHKHARLLQRADGYAYTFRKEEGVSSRP